MQLGRCDGLRFRAGGNQGSKIIENCVQHLGAECCIFGIINQMLNYGNSIQRGFQNFVGNCFSGLLELHRSLVQKRATLLAKGSMNRPRRTSKIPVFMWTLVNRILGKQVSPGGSCMATNQTSLFDGVTCTPLTSELGASNTFLFWWVWWFPQACVLLWKRWWWLQTASTIHCVSPIFKVLVHPFSIL